jgi:hypothetical protein
MAITTGALVEVVTASGRTARMRAMGEPTQGRDFPIVWVCTEGEYEVGTSEGIPWPLNAVHEVVEQGV